MAAAEILARSNIRLVPFKEEHITDTYIGWLNDPQVNRFLEVRLVQQTYETVLAYVRSFYGDTEKYMWGIHANDTKALIGTATLAFIDRHSGQGTIGLMIGAKEYWGKGYGTEIIKLIVDYAFNRLNLHEVKAGVAAKNQASAKAFQNAGFKIEDITKNHQSIDGEYRDSLHLSIVKK